MPTSADAAMPSPARLRAARGSAGRVSRFFFGDDVFISYARADATTYALALAAALTDRGLSCFLDQWGTPPGQVLPAPLLKALQRSSMLVVVASPAATRSPAVLQEVEAFLRTGRPLVPIDITGRLREADWFALIAGIASTAESAASFEAARPSPSVVDRIVHAERFHSRSRRVRRAFWMTLGGVALTLAIGGAVAWTITSRAQDLAEDAKRQAAKAQEAQREAAAARDTALDEAAVAEESRDAAQRDALLQRRSADEHRAKAELQATIASARELAIRADRARSHRENRLIESTTLAIEAARRLAGVGMPDAAVDAALRRSLGLLPRLIGVERWPKLSITSAGRVAGRHWVAVLSADARHVAISTGDRVEVRAVDTQTVLHTIEDRGRVLAVGRDGHRLVVSIGGEVRVLDRDRDSVRAVPLGMERSQVDYGALDPAGQYLALVGLTRYHSPFSQVWSLETWSFLGDLPLPDDSVVRSVAFGPRGGTLAIGGTVNTPGRRGGFARLWSFGKGHALRRDDLAIHRTLYDKPNVLAVAASPDRDSLAFAWEDGVRVTRWTSGGEPAEVARLVRQDVESLAFSVDGRALSVLSGRRGGASSYAHPIDHLTLRHWEAAGAHEVLRFGLARGIDWLRLGHRVLKTRTIGSASAWAMDTRSELPPLVALDDPRGKDRDDFVVQVGGEVSVFDKVTGGSIRVQVRPALEKVSKGTVSGDGHTLVLAGSTAARSPALAVYRKDAGRFQPAASVAAPGVIADMALNPDGTLLAAAHGDVTVWRVQGQALSPQARLSRDAQIHGVRFTPDGRWLVGLTTPVRGQQVTAFVWNSARFTGGCALRGLKDRDAFAFSADGQRLAIARADRSVVVVTLPCARPRAFTADSELRTVALDGNGNLVAAAGADDIVRLWDRESGAEIARIPHEHSVTHLAFSSTGQYLATATRMDDPAGFWFDEDRGVVRVHLVRPVDLIAEACARARMQAPDLVDRSGACGPPPGR